MPHPKKKMNFYLKRWVLVHSKITFYVYAKIGQVNGGRPPPVAPPLNPPLGLVIAPIFPREAWP